MNDSSYDRWKTTHPDCYAPYPTAICIGCADAFELTDLAWVDDDAGAGVCGPCWRAGTRPEGWDGEDVATVDPAAGHAPEDNLARRPTIEPPAARDLPGRPIA